MKLGACLPLAVFSLQHAYAFMAPHTVLTSRSKGVAYAKAQGGLPARRDFLKSSFAGLVAATLLSRPPQRAEAGFFGDEVADALDNVAKDRAKVQEIVVALKKKDLKGTPDDSAVIVRYIAAVFSPLQQTMEGLAPKLKLSDPDLQKRAETVPLLLKGHLLELKAAAKANNAAEQLEEMEEVAESVDEYLALASQKYAVKSYLQPTEWDVVKDYGVFTCEFWGKKRREGSNLCDDPDK